MPNPVREQDAHYAGIRTRELTIAGSGTPVVFLHGFADCAETWRGVLEYLAGQGRPARAVDVVGFGAADPFGPGPLLPQLDAFVDGLLATTGPAVLVGNSLGVTMSIRAAQRNPARVAGIVALDEPILSRHWLARRARGRVGPPTVASLVRLAPEPLIRWISGPAWAVLLYGNPRAADPATVLRWRTRYATRSGLSWLLTNAVRFARESVDGYPQVPVRCPVLILHGRRDRIVPVQAGADLHRLIPGSEFRVLPAAGHCPQLDDPAATAHTISTFIDTRITPRRDAAG
ncbi:alpha/beta fold hydrolase [Nocardia wallacei]|uniref:alpha/beta fold hydrolase n=1 Tax=Nocardia wallacei TaxID=480035 RepID=UPI002455DC3E|nr:alpha/beta hydrolase [Nocardia wallacei]